MGKYGDWLETYGKYGDLWEIPSGKHTKNYGKITICHGKIHYNSMAMFNSFLYVYQRVIFRLGWSKRDFWDFMIWDFSVGFHWNIWWIASNEVTACYGMTHLVRWFTYWNVDFPVRKVLVYQRVANFGILWICQGTKGWITKTKIGTSQEPKSGK